MNDRKEPFEFELKARLAVDPSQDLQARIRKCTVDAPEKRNLRFPATLALAATAVAILLLTVYVQPDRTVPSQPAAAKTDAPLPVTSAAVVVQPPKAATRTKVPALRPAPVLEISPAPTAATGLAPGPMEVPDLNGIELIMGATPIPQATLPFIASIEPITLEPLALSVRNLGVNE